jgi:hypothetical protein
MSMRRLSKQSRIIRRNGAAGVRGSQAAAGHSEPHPFRPGPSKAELRKLTAEALASYEGPITPIRTEAAQGAVIPVPPD